MNTTVDTLFNGALTLEQPAKGYRFGSDAVMLAAHLDARIGEHVLDMGCGVGAVMLSIARRLDGVQVTGIDIQEDLIALAQKNIKRNNFDKCAMAVTGDITDKALFKKLGSFDHIVLNPPYYQTSKTQSPETKHKQLSHTDIAGAIDQWIIAANRFLKPKGTITIIYPTDQLSELLTLFQRFFGAIIVTPLWPKPSTPSNRVIIQAIKGSKAPLTLDRGILMHDQ